MSKRKYQIPFDPKTGDQQHYPEPVFEHPPAGEVRAIRLDPVWRDNEVFADTLTFDGFARGRSAAYGLFRRADGTGCTVFLADLEAIVPHLAGGKISGQFTFCKRGMNYGTKLVKAG